MTLWEDIRRCLELHRCPWLPSIAALACLSCTVRELPPGARVIDRVDIVGSERVDGDEVEDRIATAETRRALGGVLEGTPILTIFDAMTVEYETYDPLVLHRDLERVRRFYRSRGFYEAQVLAGRVISTEGDNVRVEIHVREGEPVLLDRVELKVDGPGVASPEVVALQDLVEGYKNAEPASGESAPRFEEDGYDALKAELVRAMTGRGFAYAKVGGDVQVDLGRRRATAVIHVVTGPRCKFGAITFRGLDEIPEGPVRRALGFEAGERYSTIEMEDAQYALADLAVFGSIEIAPQLSKEGTRQRTDIPIVVTVQPIKLRAIGAGVGAEAGSRVELPRLVVGWEDRNFLGGLRRFDIEVRPSLLIFPLDAASLFEPPEHIRVLEQADVELRFKQPAIPEARTNTTFSSLLRHHRPRTLPDPENFDPATDNVIGFNELQSSFGFDRKFRFLFWGGNTFKAAQYIKLTFGDAFSYTQDDSPGGFDALVIPLLETVVGWDFRKNKKGELDDIDVHEGAFVGMTAQFAGGFLGGSADDIRLRPDIRVFIPFGDRVVGAFRWATGYLFARNYGDALLPDSGASDELRARDMFLLAFRGFYSGGPRSNRGYGFGDIGPQARLPFLTESQEERDTIFPVGGLGMWELSAELRIEVTENFLTVLFVDSSDIVLSLDRYRLTHPHISPGFGLRYRLPFGSLRFDWGFRPPYLQRIGHRDLEPEEGGPLPGEDRELPFSIHLAIGEAF